MKNKNENAITLIALIITIIVMLILVIVVINLATSGGLFNYAGRAARETGEALEGEQNLGSEFTINGKRYANIQDYLNGIEMPNDTLTVIVKEQPSGARPAVITAVARKMSQADLQALSEEELEEYFATAMGMHDDSYYESFHDITFGEERIDPEDVTTIDQAYSIMTDYGSIDGSQYTSATDFIIQLVSNPPTASEIQGMSESQKKELFVDAIKVLWNWPEATWENIGFYQRIRPSSVANAFEIMLDQGWTGYATVYDFILYYGVPSVRCTFVCNDETITGYQVSFLMTKPVPQTIVATCMNENEEIETGRTTVTPTQCRIEEFSQIQQNTQTLTIDGYQVPIPAGFAYGTSENVSHVNTGLVITDSVEQINGKTYSNGNEFVWIPVTAKNMKVATTSDQYVGQTSFAEPKELTGTDSTTSSQTGGPFKLDSQAELDYYFGSGYFTYPSNVSDETNVTDFSYGVHYKEMAQSVNQYGGFYVGRFETTIDSNNNIGSKVDTPILLSNSIIKEGTNPNKDAPYYYRWWGLYYAGRHANIPGNGSTVQTNMIWGQQWDKMMSFFDSNGLTNAFISTSTYSNIPQGVCNAGQATYARTYYTNNMINDILMNIYDLRANVFDITAEAYSTNAHAGRGGQYIQSVSSYASRRQNNLQPHNGNSLVGMRLTMYLK